MRTLKLYDFGQSLTHYLFIYRVKIWNGYWKTSILVHVTRVNCSASNQWCTFPLGFLFSKGKSKTFSLRWYRCVCIFYFFKILINWYKICKLAIDIRYLVFFFVLFCFTVFLFVLFRLPNRCLTNIYVMDDVMGKEMFIQMGKYWLGSCYWAVCRRSQTISLCALGLFDVSIKSVDTNFQNLCENYWIKNMLFCG